MATEDIFVAIAITNGALIALFLYLHSKTEKENELWRAVWLFGALGVANYAVVVLNYAVENGGLPDLSDMTEVILGILDWLLVLLFGYMGLILIINLGKFMINLFKHKKQTNEEKLGKTEYAGE